MSTRLSPPCPVPAFPWHVLPMDPCPRPTRSPHLHRLCHKVLGRPLWVAVLTGWATAAFSPVLVEEVQGEGLAPSVSCPSEGQGEGTPAAVPRAVSAAPSAAADPALLPCSAKNPSSCGHPESGPVGIRDCLRPLGQERARLPAALRPVATSRPASVKRRHLCKLLCALAPRPPPPDSSHRRPTRRV